MALLNKSPDEPLHCLIVQPKTSEQNFWNCTEACKLMGAKAVGSPLGLITVAAILPQHWKFTLVDLHAEELTEHHWKTADLVCTGGMIPQQESILKIIAEANKRQCFVMVGGADPSSQPHIYKNADLLVIGEAEETLPQWIHQWRAGFPQKVIRESGKPAVNQSPVPRFDLLNFRHYARIGVQYSRGCPFNCEFCDIIELYGRKQRVKTSEQFIRELDALYTLGYTGNVDIVDDNFIGNKNNVKKDLLPAIIAWNRKRHNPFYYHTAASMNLADDDKLLELMREAEFRMVFMGIETPDLELLMMTQKKQNTTKPIVDRVQKMYDYGIFVIGGFIMGFDNEKKHLDDAMIELIEDTGINIAMIAMLVALPNTQLSRRLAREGRLLSLGGQFITDPKDIADVRANVDSIDVFDHILPGLNFVPTRHREEICIEYANVIRSIFSVDRYFDRAARLARRLKARSRHRRSWFEIKRQIIGLINMSKRLLRAPHTRWRYLRTFAIALKHGHAVTEEICRIMGMYIHFEKQADFLLQKIEEQIREQKEMPPEFLSLEALKKRREDLPGWKPEAAYPYMYGGKGALAQERRR